MANPQPEVHYNARAPMQQSAPSAPPSPAQMEGATGQSSLTPQNRLLGRGVASGVGAALGGGVSDGGSLAPPSRIKHSASTPALSIVGSTPAPAGFVPGGKHVLNSVPPSPALSATAAGSMSPSYSINAHTPQATAQRHSVSQSPPVPAVATQQQAWAGMAGSRRKQRPPLVVEWQQARGRLVRKSKAGRMTNTPCLLAGLSCL